MQCDHGNDQEVQKLFDKVSKEQNGRLDILVNNAFKGVKVQSVSNSQAATNNRCNLVYMMHRLGMALRYSQSSQLAFLCSEVDSSTYAVKKPKFKTFMLRSSKLPQLGHIIWQWHTIPGASLTPADRKLRSYACGPISHGRRKNMNHSLNGPIFEKCIKVT